MAHLLYFKVMIGYKRSKASLEVNNEPSMTEAFYNPTISEILQNPACLITSKVAMFDDGDEVCEVPSRWDNDLQDHINLERARSPKVTARPTPEEAAPAASEDADKGAQRDEEKDEQ